MDDGAAAAIGILIFLGFFILLVAIGPIFSIWAINTLFGTEIVLSFKTWCAMAWLHLLIGGSAIKKKKNNEE